MYLRSITMSFHRIASTSIRSLSLSSFLSSESRSNACIDYAESQKKYSRARIELITRFISGASTGSATDMESPHHHITKSVLLPNYMHKKRVPRLWNSSAVRTGLEPATSGVTGRYSNRLNYRTKTFSVSIAMQR